MASAVRIRLRQRPPRLDLERQRSPSTSRLFAASNAVDPARRSLRFASGRGLRFCSGTQCVLLGSAKKTCSHAGGLCALAPLRWRSLRPRRSSGACAGQLSQPSDPYRHPLPRRRSRRHRRAHHRPEDERGMGPAGRRRQSPRRQHHHRRRVRRQGRARRLHADDGNRFDAGDEPVSLQKPALRSAQRFRSDHDDREIDVAPRRASGRRAEDRERADRARQGRARQAQFRRRHDHRAAHGRACSTRPPASTWSMCRSRAPRRRCRDCSPARPT